MHNTPPFVPHPPEGYSPPDALVDGTGWVGIMSQWVMWKVFHLGEFLDPEGTPQWLWRRGQQRPAGLKAV